MLGPCLAHPATGVLKLKGEYIRDVFMPKNNTALIVPVDQCTLQSLLSRWAACWRCKLLSENGRL